MLTYINNFTYWHIPIALARVFLWAKFTKKHVETGFTFVCGAVSHGVEKFSRGPERGFTISLGEMSGLCIRFPPIKLYGES